MSTGREYLFALVSVAFGGIAVQATAWAGDVCPTTVANQRDVSFSVVWGTAEATVGYVEFGTHPENLDRVACDDRDPGMSCGLAAETHFVTVTGLTPSATYFLRTVTDGVAADSLLEVVMGPTLSIPSTDSVYGQVFRSDHTTPADGAYVCATIADRDAGGSSGSSSPACSLVASSYWSLNLGNVRTQELLTWFDYSDSGDDLLLAACGAGVGCDVLQVDTAADAPAVDIYLDTECDCIPAETAELQADKQESILLTWSEMEPSIVYDVAGGLIAELRADQGVAGALCLAGGLGAPGWNDPGPPPFEGTAHYFITRARNSCGVSTYGASSGGSERVPIATCP